MYSHKKYTTNPNGARKVIMFQNLTLLKHWDRYVVNNKNDKIYCIKRAKHPKIWVAIKSTTTTNFNVKTNTNFPSLLGFLAKTNLYW